MSTQNQTRQLTFEQSRIRPYDGSKDCGKLIKKNGDIIQCSNTAFLTVKNNDEIIFRCWHHSKDSWKEVLESKEIFGGR